MPYIAENRRPAVDRDIDRLIEGLRQRGDWSPGTLNYIITRVADRWIRAQVRGVARRQRPDGLSYAGIAAAVGVLETAKLELYRRLAAPYEDEMLFKNGDVYGRD